MKLDLRRRMKLRPERVQPGRIDDAAVVFQAALAVEHGHLQPAIVRAEAGGPEHGADALGFEVDEQSRRLRNARRGEALGGGDVAAGLVVRDPVVDAIEQSAELQVGHRAVVAQGTGELGLAVGNAGEPAHDLEAAADVNAFRSSVARSGVPMS